MLLARWLGPEDYGRMAFLLASFMAFKQLFDMASSSAFFTFLSQKPRSQQFISYYWRWVTLQFLISFLLVALLLPEGVLNTVWENESRGLIVLAMVAAFMQQHVWSIASRMAEAQRETIRVQKLNTIVVLVHLVVVVGLWKIGQLFLPLLFVIVIVEWSLAGWLAARMYRSGEEDSKEAEGATLDTPKSVFNEFWHYCLPFVPYAWLGFVHNFADRWMLQHWGGASEQAYYAVAQQFSAVALLATTSILRIFWKEIAEAKHRGDHEQVRHLYHKVSRGLYCVGAVVAGGLLPWSEEIITLLLGDAYRAGAITLMLMFLYPVHQTIGQIGGTMLYATEHTRIQVVLGLIFMAVSIVVVYFMLAPGSMQVPGFGLASQGLAIKMVALQLISVNVQAWFIARIFGWKFDWTYQVVGLGLAVVAGWGAKSIMTSVITAHITIEMVATGFLYITLVFFMFYLLPWLMGMTRDELNGYLLRFAVWGK